jgi:hypothetical protein
MHDGAKPILSAHALACFPSASQAAKQKSVSFYQTGGNLIVLPIEMMLPLLLSQNNNKR